MSERRWWKKDVFSSKVNSSVGKIYSLIQVGCAFILWRLRRSNSASQIKIHLTIFGTIYRLRNYVRFRAIRSGFKGKLSSWTFSSFRQNCLRKHRQKRIISYGCMVILPQHCNICMRKISFTEIWISLIRIIFLLIYCRALGGVDYFIRKHSSNIAEIMSVFLRILFT